MAGDGVVHGEAGSVSLHPSSGAAAGVGEGQMLSGSIKRKAAGSVVPTSEDGCTKKKAADPAAFFSEIEKPSDSMAVDGCDDDDWVPAELDEEGKLIVPKELREHPAGVDENGDLIMDDELLEHLEWVKTLKIVNLRDVPGVTIWSGADNDESEEEGEEVVQEPNTN